MKSFTRASVAATAILLSSQAYAQYAIDPESVGKPTRDNWCLQQTSTCPLICLDQGASSGTTEDNDCDPDALTYSCVCSNGLSPNLSEYSQTLPYNICTEWGNQCVSNCNGAPQCESACRQDHPCGATNPTRQNTSTLTKTMSQTASQTGSGGSVTTDSNGESVTIYTGFAGSGPSETGKSGGNGGGNSGNNNNNNGGGNGGSQSAAANVRVWALSTGQTFGTLGLAGVAALGFAVLL